MRETRTHIPLWLKLLVGALLLAVLPAITIGTMSYLRSRDVLQREARRTQTILAEQLVSRVQATFASAQKDMYAVAQLLVAELPDAEKLALINSAISASEMLDHVVIYDAKGDYVDRVAEQHDAQIPAAPKTWTARDREHFEVGDAVAMPSEVRVPVAMALRSHADVITGYLLSYVSMAPVQAQLERLSVEFLDGHPRNMLVIDREVRAVAASSSALALGLVSQREIELLRNAGSELVLKATKITGPEYRDGNAIMVGALVPVLGWPFSLVVQQPRDIVYAELALLRTRIMIVVGVALAIAALLAFGFARAVTAPIRRLVAFTRMLAARNFSERVTVDTRDELATLGYALNKSAQDLGDSEDKIRREHEIRNDLSRYLPAPIVEKVVAREQDMGLGGTRRDISVVFADVVGFTPLTGKLEPEVVVSILNELFTIMSEIVFRHGGMIDKFIGDSMMAIWGAPEPSTDHAERAVAAALDMQKWLEFGRKRWQDRYDISIDVAIGINSGPAVVGNIGSQTRMEYTAIGESVNVAARVESVARPRQVLITAATKAQLSDSFDVVEIGPQQLPGRDKPTMLYEVNA